jgi:glyoxylase-like metal-dependent hydrolase (beta-lactamase superfamily II)
MHRLGLNGILRELGTKRLVLSLLMIMIVMVSQVAAAIADESVPGWLDPQWYPDPLASGVEWWRDAANQNALAQYYYDVFPQIPHVETVIPGVYVVRGVGTANVVALVGETEWVLIDSMASPPQMQLALLLLRPYIGTRPLKDLIYTGEAFDHYGGSSIVAPMFSIPVYASAEFFTSLALHSSMQGVYFPRMIQTLGMMLPQDPDWRIGPSPMYGKYTFQYPNRLISEPTTVNLAGFNLELIPAPSATEAGLLVWLPDLKVLAAGDAVSPSFPDIGPLTGPSLSPTAWMGTLGTMLSLSPDYLIPTHGPVITTNEEAVSLITNYRDAITFVRDRTLYWLNTGLTADEAAQQIALPEPLASDPYLQEFIANIPSAVRGIAQQYVGWFNGQPPELASTLTTTRRAEIMVELGGGVENMRDTALNAELNANDQESAEKALLLSWALNKVAPDDMKAAQIYAQALRKCAYMEKSGQTRNYYLATAKAVNGTVMDLTPPEVTVSAPVDGASYVTGDVPEPAYTVTDDLLPDPTVEVTGWSDEVGEHTMTVTATDASGKVGSASVTYTVYDAYADNTPPEVTIAAPMDGGVYLAGNVPEAEYTVTDDTDPEPMVTVSGWSSEVGVHTFTVTATDSSGNVGSASATYTVLGVIGPLPPLQSNGKGKSDYKAGSTIPVKFQLTDDTGLFTSATGTVSIGAASASFRWDEAAQQYVANVKTVSPGTNVAVVLVVEGAGSVTLTTIVLR